MQESNKTRQTEQLINCFGKPFKMPTLICNRNLSCIKKQNKNLILCKCYIINYNLVTKWSNTVVNFKTSTVGAKQLHWLWQYFCLPRVTKFRTPPLPLSHNVMPPKIWRKIECKNLGVIPSLRFYYRNVAWDLYPCFSY